MNRKKIFLSLIIILIVFASIVCLITFEEESTYMSYKNFTIKLQEGMIESVLLLDDKVEFCLKNEEVNYYTENPEYDNFKEYLLLNDVRIENGFGSDDVTFILDVIFYLVFVIAMGFGGYKLIGFSRNNFKIIKNTNTKFDDIAGMENIKKDMMKVVDILKNPAKYREKGIRPPKGIVLEGPPGNGKTLFARALAGEANINFIATKGADFQSAMMSVGPRKIKTLFQKARRNKPCIIFIDEFDGIGERRNYAGSGIDKENNRLIISMLNEMDGFSNEDGVLVIAATNSYSSLDAALVRPGRFDIKYKIENPDKDTILALIELYTKKKKLDSKVNMPVLVKCFEKLSCAAIETIFNEATLIADGKNKETITIEDISEAGKKTGTVNIKIC